MSQVCSSVTSGRQKLQTSRKGIWSMSPTITLLLFSGRWAALPTCTVGRTSSFELWRWRSDINWHLQPFSPQAPEASDRGSKWGTALVCLPCFLLSSFCSGLILPSFILGISAPLFQFFVFFFSVDSTWIHSAANQELFGILLQTLRYFCWFSWRKSRRAVCSMNEPTLISLEHYPIQGTNWPQIFISWKLVEPAKNVSPSRVFDGFR